MTTRAHFWRAVTDTDGNVVPNTRVAVYEAGTTNPIGQSLYTQKIGSPTLDNPFTTSNGFIEFYLDNPQSVRIGLTVQGSTETYVDDLPVLPAPESLVSSVQAFQVVNTSTPGYFMQAGAVGQAAWVDAGDLVNSKPSPLRQVRSYDVSGGVIEDLVITDAAGNPVTPIFADVTADPKPAGWTFTGALLLPTSSRVTVRVPAQTFPESGTVIYLYKVISVQQGVGAAVLHVGVDEDLLFAETPTVADLMNTWSVGYLDEIPAGTHRVAIEHRPGTDSASYVLIGPIWLQYGNNIPAHDHTGPLDQTVRLGTGALVGGAGATAVGANANASGPNATALGFAASGMDNAVAVGKGATAAVDAIAIGYRTAGALDQNGWIAVGKDAWAGGASAVALGPVARAEGAESVAVGSGARAGSAGQGVALGPSALAMGYRSVALGQGATVAAGHDYSVAIGPGVATTDARQARIGDAQTTVVVPGTLRQTGGSALLAGAGSKLGFYGSAGVLKPTVTGSRGGNATLTALLAALAQIGLITDGSTP
jgi:hypothetical protein